MRTGGTPLPAAPTDVELVAGMRAGDRAALGTAYDRYATELFDLCVRTGGRDDAEDAVQDTFLSAMASIDQLREPSKLRPWLFSIARNRVRRRGRSHEMASDSLDDLATETAEPDSRLVRQEQAEVLETALGGLESQDREVVLLRDRHGLDGSEAALVLGTDRATVDRRLHEARQRLRRSVVACAVGAHNANGCEELARLRGGGTFSPTVRKRVSRHIERCEACSRSAEQTATPASLLGTLPMLVPPIALRRRLLSAFAPTGDDAPGDAAQTPPMDPSRAAPVGTGSTRALTLLGGAAAVTALVVAGWFMFRLGVEDSETAGAGQAAARDVTPDSTEPEPDNVPPLPEPADPSPSFCDVVDEARGWYAENPGPASADPAAVQAYFTGSLSRLTELTELAPADLRDELGQYTDAMAALVASLAPTWDLTSSGPASDLVGLRDLLETELAQRC